MGGSRTQREAVAAETAAPLRAELLTPDRIADRARELADTQSWTPEGAGGRTPLIALMQDAAQELAALNATLAAAVRAQQAISPASEWLLDNYYLAEEQVRAVKEDLPEHYGQELPSLREGPLRGYPRVYEAMTTLIAHTDSRIDEEYLCRFVDGFQDISPLSIGEVWALPIMLRIALVENVRRLARRVVRMHTSANDADVWADRLLLTAQDQPHELRALVDILERDVPDASPSFLMRLSQRFSGQEVGADAVTGWLERQFAALGVELDVFAHELHQQQAADQVSIANAITAIRFLDAYDWHEFFEANNFVEQVLRQDPAGVYPRMDFNSRDRYRHSLEMMSRRCPHSEIELAEATISWCLLTLDEEPAEAKRGHVGYYLISGGRCLLEESVDYRLLARERLYRGPLRRREVFFGTLLVLLTGAVEALLVWFALASGASTLATLILAAIALIPASDIALQVTNRIASSVFPPRRLPRLDFGKPISEAHRTLVIVPTLLSSVRALANVLGNLEVAYLANRDDNIAFGLLGDLKAAKDRHTEGDAEIVEAALRGIELLNDRYEAEHGRRPFELFLRGRRFSEGERTWMGWERKRGALVELNRVLRGSAETTFTHRVGDESFLRSVTFVLTLDADTLLPRDGARKLISTIAHPLNRARYSPGDPRVLDGYGLVQPRVAMSLPAASRSFFAWLHSGETGVDPYAGAVSDTYQDVFGEGSFTGKGIFEVNVFNAVLEGRFPDNTLLSHDLVEGCFLRTALASDIEVFDDYPANYLSHASRLQRWVRGDWQTLPWLARHTPVDGEMEPNPLSLLHQFKILDNLRRSLVAPTLLVMMSIGWLLLSGPAWAWPLIMLLLVMFPVYFSLLDGLIVRRRRDMPLGRAIEPVWHAFVRDAARTGLLIVLLPHTAWLMVDAIARAVWRMTVSHHHLLEWETAADAERRAARNLAGFARVFLPSSAAAIALLAVGASFIPVRLAVAASLAVVWTLAPWVAWRVSRPPRRAAVELGEPETSSLRRTARRTWRFFETFVTADGHHLAPDNYQEDPGETIAWRTSPTNIGLQLLSTMAAFDLGYVSLRQLMQRSTDTLGTMAGLERFRGHFYNWYDIQTLSPLPPKYVSTVDSGNLAGHLLVLRVGLLEASEAPLLGPQLLRGFVDTATVAVEDLSVAHDALEPAQAARALRDQLAEFARDVALEEAPTDLGEWHALLRRLDSLASGSTSAALDLLNPTPAEDTCGLHPTTPTAAVCASVEAIRTAVREAHDLLGELAPWAPLLSETPRSVLDDPRAPLIEPMFSLVPSLVGLAEGLEEALETLDAMAQDPPGTTPEERDASRHWCTQLTSGVREARPRCVDLLARLRLDASIAREMWEHTDFKMLFDEHRLLFSIGYNTAEGHLDPSYYDMLASECRLASFLAVAKGDVPQEHWFRLSRSITETGNGRALLSWSASMFEYLMPLLVMRSWPMTLLDETYRSVVRRQVEYGRERGIPWGVSESAFNAKDAQLIYQYQAFGVPGLGLKRGLSDDVVVAPYASVLALPVAPLEVLRNLHSLTEQGARGRYGFFEAVDFTPGRVPAGERRAIVCAYFAHHQGMSLVALSNHLSDGAIRRRFHADPMVASAELLLQERVPRAVQLAHPHIEEVRHVRSLRELPPPVTRAYPLADTPVPATHFLSNGRYSVMVTNGGGGYSRWRDLAVTRYREDVTRDCWGQFVYVRDAEADRVWTAAYNPCPTRPDEYYATFSADKAEFRRRDGDFETSTEISVSPEDDVEVRRITLTNRGRETRHIEVTSYFEIALTAQAADQAHRSFSNLFVETEALPDLQALLFSRRPRSSEEARVWGVHVLGCESTTECEWSFETDRARFLGRVRQADSPQAVMAGGALAGTSGAVLDPCCAIRQSIDIPGGGSARFVFATGVAESRETALHLAETYHDVRSAQRAVDLAWTSAQIELKDLGIDPHEAVVYQRLASRLLLTDPYSQLKVITPVENGLPTAALWSLGISGDLPILLVRVDELEHGPLVRQALLAHQYWRQKGLVADLVVLNTRPSAYVDELDDRLKLLVRTGHALQLMDRPGGVFLRRADQMHPDTLNLLLTVARATLDGDCGSLELQLNRRANRPEDPDPFIPTRAAEEFASAAFERPALAFDNGYGGFDTDRDEYVIVLEDGRATPAPWINVIAWPQFGCTVSEAGIGCTWALNSHENRITTWNNDPVSDGSGEVLYIRDEDTGKFWSPTPLPCPDGEPYVVRHGKGYTRFEHTSHGIEQSIDWFVPSADPVRLVRVTLRNAGDRTRNLSVTQFVEWALGSSRSQAQHLVVTWFDPEAEMLTAHNHRNADFPGRPAFLACDRTLHSYTASRTEFVGRNRRPADPAAMRRRGLGARTGRFHDNCGALMARITIEPGAEESITFMLGQTDSLEEARSVVARYRRPGLVEKSLASARREWASLLQAVKVRTPDPALDLLVNGQLLYQAVSCRLWGRTATYQSSGAYGFRDQLQDVMALLLVRPDLVREQIVEASRHQFEQGDVLHWWQPFSGRGVRTRISDDRHWLPLVVAEYIDATGDTSVLEERTAFLAGPEIEPGLEDSYQQPSVSEHAASVYEHCIRALESGRKTGPHGLPLIGGGDWNDGMNRVGIGGVGESVWLAWFLNVVLTRFAPVCESQGETERAEQYRVWAASIISAVESGAWDGSWYRRAYFDDGTPLGSRESVECRIDAVAQSWAVISGAGDPQRAQNAVDAVEEKLVRREDGLITLLAPPFDRMPKDPGYIKGYVPGVRENGGQYTHAAVWVILAYLLLGDGDEAYGLLQLINPVNHALDREAADTYKVEPYVVAADVYAAEPHVGRGGWTWYTGSASWFYRVVVRDLLGLSTVSRDGERYLRIEPCIPKSWDGYEMTVRLGEATFHIRVDNPRGVNRGVARVEVDGRALDVPLVPIPDEGTYQIVVTLLGG